MNTDMVSMGNRLKERRKELGLTQTDIHAKCGIASGAMSQIENGSRTPSAITLYNLAQVLECDMEWLISGASTESKNNLLCEKEELELLNGFRQLGIDDRDEIMALLDVKLRRIKRDNKTMAKLFSSEVTATNDKMA